MDLLLGLLEPSGGRITVDGTPLTPEPLPRWQTHVGYVPQSMFLTDATSALHGSTELGVFDAIAHLAVRKTIVMIAHRLATIESCDPIHLLDDGEIAAFGTYDELLRGSPTLRSFAQGAAGDSPGELTGPPGRCARRTPTVQPRQLCGTARIASRW